MRLDGQQKVGHALDLVDDRRSVVVGDESGGVGGRRVARPGVVESEDLGAEPIPGDLLHQRALADLSRAEHHDDSRVLERFEHARLERPSDHLAPLRPPRQIHDNLIGYSTE